VGKNTPFDHATTGFKLSGQHASVACADCHAGLKFSTARPSCSSCHADVHKSELGENCLSCHSMQTWKIADMVEKHAQTRFTLLGRHRVLVCESCHHNATNYQYRGTPIECVSCHRADYDATANPNHASAGFSTDCISCHTVTSYTWDHSFDHAMTAFPLTGAHIATPCSNCHINGAFKGTPTQCISCHQSDFAGTTDPNHAQNNFPTNCMQCHTTTAWQPSTFNHSSTRFALTGEHARVECQACHTNGNYALTYTGCNQCHSSNFAGTTNPNHTTLNFSRVCETCHTTTNWSSTTYDHSTTNFPLTGKHTTTQCQSCHVNNNYQLTYSSCYQCHQPDYAGTTNPNHASLNFSQTCQTCHTTTAWIPSTFNHDAQYFRIYSGRHLQTWTLCSQCHVDNTNYANFSCLNCHEHAQSTMDQKHSGVSGYIYASPSCYSCHRRV